MEPCIWIGSGCGISYYIIRAWTDVDAIAWIRSACGISDVVVVAKATEIPFSVVAEIKILQNQETATVYSNAIESLTTGLAALKQIGTDITLSEINDFLKVDGVKEVVITSPAANVVVADSEIGVNSGNTITYTVIWN